MDGGGRWGDVPTDVLWEILRRLPQITGRRWRDVVDEIEPEVQRRRAKPLAFFKNGCYEPPSAFSLHDIAGDCDVTSLFREEKQEDNDGGDRDFFARYNNDDMVGSCNGLICLWLDRSYSGGCGIFVTNPVTGETLHIPSPPLETMATSSHRRTAGPLCFGYHPTTGKYKIVHFPSNGGRVDDVTLGGTTSAAAAAAASSFPSRHGGVVNVLTLGDGAASWRAVGVPPWSLCIAWGVVSVDGATYWVAEGREIMSFDLEHERVAAVAPLPAMSRCRLPVSMAKEDACCQLTDVGGRLGVSIAIHQRNSICIEVWLLEGRGGKQKWSKWRTIQGLQPTQKIGRPYFAYGNCVLTNIYREMFDQGLNNIVYRHLPCSLKDGSIISRAIEGTPVAKFKNRKLRMFSYIETSEPLNIYK
ncbi:F-box protein At3g07870 [Oryza sativa Japonica Group]|uniref:F-box protein interaction domain containing protein n=1 Tax=Oryza sativa subsp. japonica TaxID=39947 RepID=Q2QQI2_ORYSJ|nr:F-box protein At3g07870-like [Oryza sativa Japonica Group]ABA98622.1 F-box protein interaction domain containing protein [Oryza sativa Japonica Group]USI00816.1 F-box protein interaction domain-containing protein [Oryza sativa Japonica Group]BAT17210.1 Os12g0493200 [Oryza sativa Japonica Group]